MGGGGLGMGFRDCYRCFGRRGRRVGCRVRAESDVWPVGR